MMPKNRKPTHPGDILREEFLKPLGMSNSDLAKKLGISANEVSYLVDGGWVIYAGTAIKLAKIFKTTPEFWMNLQMNYDLYCAKQELKRSKK